MVTSRFPTSILVELRVQQEGADPPALPLPGENDDQPAQAPVRDPLLRTGQYPVRLPSQSQEVARAPASLPASGSERAKAPRISRKPFWADTGPSAPPYRIA